MSDSAVVLRLLAALSFVITISLVASGTVYRFAFDVGLGFVFMFQFALPMIALQATALRAFDHAVATATLGLFFAAGYTAYAVFFSILLTRRTPEMFPRDVWITTAVLIALSIALDVVFGVFGIRLAKELYPPVSKSPRAERRTPAAAVAAASPPPPTTGASRDDSCLKKLRGQALSNYEV